MTTTPLTGQTSVLIGATGNIGHGLVQAQLDAGARVVPVGRNRHRLDALRHRFPDHQDTILPVAGDIGTLASAEQTARDVVDQAGQIDHVVVGLNAWMQGEPFWNVSEDTWQQTLDNITAYFAASRAFAPHIRPGGSLTLILGLSAYMALPLASPITIYGGALRAMRPAFSGDLGDKVRVNTAAFAFIATPSRGANVNPDWLTDHQVGQVMTRIAATDISGADLQIPDHAAYTAFVNNA